MSLRPAPPRMAEDSGAEAPRRGAGRCRCAADGKSIRITRPR